MIEHLDRRAFLGLTSTAVLGGLCGACSNGSHPPQPHSGNSHSSKPHWSYSGDTGPDHWASLSNAYKVCATGADQSPINIASSEIKGTSSRVTLVYRPVSATSVDNGHTLQVNVDSGCTAIVDDTRYELRQFHYHTPSDHTIDGKHRTVEWHFVHESVDKNLAVVAVLVNLGTQNTAFAEILSHPPDKNGDRLRLTSPVDVAAMMPSDLSALRYQGSLSTPPCTEGVKWIVLRSAVEMSSDQVAVVQHVLNNNDRPVQPLNGRSLQRAAVTVE